MKHPSKTGLYATAATLLAALLATEVFLAYFAPLIDPYGSFRAVRHYIRSEHQPNMRLLTTPEPGLPGVEGVNEWTTNSFGFRGPDIDATKPANEYRVFLVGGSTTECLILDDKDSLDAVVQSTLQEIVGNGASIKVYNAGVSGHRSDDHVAIVTQRIIHLEPDFIVIFSGINDLRAAISGHDYLHPSAPGIATWKLAATRSQLGRLAHYVLKGRRPEPVYTDQEPWETAYHVGVEAQRAAKKAAGPPQTNVAAYSNNLKTLAGLSRSHAVPMLFMTQQTTWNSSVDPDANAWHWLLRVGDERYSEQNMHGALESMNDVMRQIASANDIAIYDLARDIPKSLEYFYDDVHFNLKGAEYAGKKLAVAIGTHISAKPAELNNVRRYKN